MSTVVPTLKSVQALLRPKQSTGLELQIQSSTADSKRMCDNDIELRVPEQ